MTNDEYRKDCLSFCGMAAMDCKESADYARFHFEQGQESEARHHVENLEKRLASLRGAMSSLDYANRKIKGEPADGK